MFVGRAGQWWARFRTFPWWVPAGFVALAVMLALVQNQIPQWLAGDGPAWITSLLRRLYPHLAAEKARFGPEFLLAKARQMTLRALLAAGLFTALAWLWQRQRTRWQFSDAQARRVGMAWLLLSLFYAKDIWPDLLQRQPVAFLYQPIAPLGWALSTYPGAPVLFGLYVMQALAVGVALWSRRFRVSSAALAIATVWVQQLLLYSFGKTDHTYASFNYLALVVPLLFLPAASQWLSLGRVLVGLCYLFPAAEKLLAAGWAWGSYDTIAGYLYMQSTPAGLWLVAHPTLAVIIARLGWLFQAGAWVPLVWPRLSWPFILLGIAFHWGTYLLFGAGSWDSPWVATLVLAFASSPAAVDRRTPA